MATLVDGYSESNYSTSRYNSVGDWAYGQSFTGNGGILDSCKFYLGKWGNPTGSVYAKVYAHSGTYGSSSVPTGSALAISDTVFDISTFALMSLKTFTFSGENKITLENGTYYVVVVEYNDGDDSNGLNVGVDYISPSHDGNSVRYLSSTWSARTDDTCFYVYSDDPPTTSTTSSSSSSTSISTSTTSSSSISTSTTSSSISSSTTSSSSSTSTTSSSSSSSSSISTTSSSSSISTTSSSSSVSTSTTSSSSSSTSTTSSSSSTSTTSSSSSSSSTSTTTSIMYKPEIKIMDKEVLYGEASYV